MAYAVVASYAGASKTTVNIGGVNYDVYEFASLAGGSITFSQGGDVDHAIVAGGATGGRNTTGGGRAAGGGAGGVLDGTAPVAAGTFPIIVGPGAAAPASGGVGNSGSSSSALGLTAIGGGAGAASGGGTEPLVGGSGGGGGGANSGSASYRPAALGTPGQGHRGGDGGIGSNLRGGGGGGAGGPGANADNGSDVAFGGLPKLLTITGTDLWVAAGGSARNSSAPANWGGPGSGTRGWHSDAVMGRAPGAEAAFELFPLGNSGTSSLDSSCLSF